MTLFGKRQTRAEDAALLTGAGRFIDDIRYPGMLHVAIVRSAVARAGISVDTREARKLKGVVAAIVAEDLPASARVLPDGHPNPALPDPAEPPVLAHGEVRYVGEPVAAVVAETPYVAEDGAKLVDVDYDARPAIVDLERAAKPTRPWFTATGTPTSPRGSGWRPATPARPSPPPGMSCASACPSSAAPDRRWKPGARSPSGTRSSARWRSGTSRRFPMSTAS